MQDLTQNIQYIKGVGPNRSALLNKLGIFTLEDLITYYPRDYEEGMPDLNRCIFILNHIKEKSALQIKNIF